MEPMADAATTTGAAAALERRARDLDAADPLRAFRERFVAIGDDAGVVAYLDGNSLGRPPRTSPRCSSASSANWGARLIRGWDEGWMELGPQSATASAGSCSAPRPAKSWSRTRRP